MTKRHIHIHICVGIITLHVHVHTRLINIKHLTYNKQLHVHVIMSKEQCHVYNTI